MMSPKPLLEVSELTVAFGHRRRHAAVRALDGVSLQIFPGETVAVVGESGSGKSTLGRSVLGLVSPSGGSISYDSSDITHASFARRRALSAEIQVVFQNPYSSLNPSRRIGDTLAEPLLVHSTSSRKEARRKTAEMLHRVGLPSDVASRYPRQFSGGQLQRIAIARALMVSPRLLILDEALSALDLSVQAQVVNLLLELRDQLALTYLFIAHDLDMVRHFAHRVVVLYRGRVVESGTACDVCENPKHPYTAGLVASAPVPDPALQRARRISAAKRVVTAVSAPVGSEGCAFAPRCQHAKAICREEVPAIMATPEGGMVRCHRYPELSAAGSLTT
jgi:oligopeptide/dipeptide ABC transporter ATP-binding protein